MGIFKNTKPKNVFRGKNKAIKYLNKSNRKTTQSDLLKLYAAGTLDETLSKYNFDVIEIYVDGNKKLGLDLQINLRIGNRNFGIDFLEEHYETCFYVAGCTPEDFEKSIVRYDYKDFDLEKLFQEVESNSEK